ncbi:MAG: DUF899 family protein [Pseudomonadota bacterium]
MPPISYPDETAAYRAARNELLEAERALRRQLDEVATLRRALPDGGRVPEPYQFIEATGMPGQPLEIDALFARPEQSLVIYSYMFGDAAAPCPMCTSFLDGLNAVAKQLLAHVNLAVVATASPLALHRWANERGWQSLSFFSDGDGQYSRDYLGTAPDGSLLPMLNVFRRSASGIRHHYGSELLFADPEPGQHPRHLDLLMPHWNLFDLIPEGRPAAGVPVL